MVEKNSCSDCEVTIEVPSLKNITIGVVTSIGSLPMFYHAFFESNKTIWGLYFFMVGFVLIISGIIICTILEEKTVSVEKKKKEKEAM